MGATDFRTKFEWKKIRPVQKNDEAEVAKFLKIIEIFRHIFTKPIIKMHLYWLLFGG